MTAPDKISEALDILKAVGLPRAQQNDRSALCLLAISDISDAKSWYEATNPLIGISETPSYYRVENTIINTLDSCSISENRSISGLKRTSGIFANNPNKRQPCRNTE